MLFNSVGFIFGFVPLTLLGFFMLGRWRPGAALAWLTLASLVFYTWWKPVWLPLMLVSIAFNFAAGLALARAGPGPRWVAGLPRRTVLAVAVGANLALLFHYKYSAFVFGNVAAWLGLAAGGPQGELPLGISFFTFTQIAFLVDVYQRKAADFSPVRYGLFVTYYPHLIAGPILHHREMMPQFARADIFVFSAARLAQGLTIFTLGLFKKVVLADRFAAFANPAFDAARTQALSFFESWGAALSYTLQLYFDFSGYSDMAIGLALMIGITLPLNFHSPYKARDIAEFWRRWHMTLSRFLRDYLYVPLGGNRKGPRRRYLNLMLTMLLGGLWHGAGWSFVVWGGLHGLYLVVHSAWRQALQRWWPQAPAWPGAGALAWLLTFTSVVVAWVFFRAVDLPTALSLLRGMAGLQGSLLPDQIIGFVPALGYVAQGAGKVPYLGDGTVMGAVELALMLALGLAIVRLAPALHELRPRTRSWLVVPCGALALQQVLYGRASQFLYFQF
jgi:D-alanyl-lipoteichoic acid acyltransferase DltB (MBOAT superfamily)